MFPNFCWWCKSALFRRSKQIMLKLRLLITFYVEKILSSWGMKGSAFTCLFKNVTLGIFKKTNTSLIRRIFQLLDHTFSLSVSLNLRTVEVENRFVASSGRPKYICFSTFLKQWHFYENELLSNIIQILLDCYLIA